MDSEKLLIIGCGDIGRRLARRVAAKGVAVTGLRRHPPSSRSAQIRYVAGDYRDRATMETLLAEGFNAVVLTLTPQERSDEGYRLGYVEPVRALVDAIARSSQAPRRVLMVGSTAVYGQSDGEWVDECSPTQPQRYNGQRLLEAERLLLGGQIAAVILRLAGVYGPGRERMLNTVREARAAASAAYTNRIHVEDAAAAIDHLLYRVREPEAVYLGSDGESPTKAEVVRWLAGELGAPQPVEESAQSLNKRIDNRRLLATGFTLQYRGFREGFAELIRP